MVIARVQKILTLTCLGFIGLFFIMGTLPISKYTFTGGTGSQSPSPTTAFGEVPTDSTPLLKDSGFDQSNWWNYTSSPNVNASWNSIEKKGFFNHTSPSTGITQPLLIDQATYKGTEQTNRVQNLDGTTLKVDEGTLGAHRIFNVFFPENFKDGDIILLYFTSGNPCHISVRNPDNQSAPLYGLGYFACYTAQAVNISLSGVTTPQLAFNLDIDFTLPTQSAYVDQVMGYWTPSPKTFIEEAYINQTISTPTLFNVSYNLQCTGNVSAFQNILYANVSVQINTTLFWSRLLSGTFSDTSFSIQLPHDVLQKGGDFAIVFRLILAVYSAAAVDFKFYIDNVYLNQTPNTNLLDDSPCITGIPWTFLTAPGYSGVYLPIYEILVLSSTSSAEGGVRILQQFNKTSSQPNYTLVFNYAAINMSGINHVNITVNINNTNIGNIIRFNQTSASWAEFRVNSTDAVLNNQIYVLNITIAVKPQSAVTPTNWIFALDNIYLYPNWGSDLTRLGGAYDPDITAGEIKEVSYQYNATGKPNTPIRDANVTVINKDTGEVWGLDRFGSSKFQVTNYENGTYDVELSTVGFSVGLYNLSVIFYRPNFPDTTNFIQLNILGSTLNVTFSSGAHFNDTHQIWFVNEDNLPYIDDTTKKITIYVTDPNSKSPITDAFVEAELSENVLAWTEVYKSSGNPSDKGLYDIFIDTMGLSPYTEYLLLNFSVRVTASGYSAQTAMVSTIVKPLPASIAVPDILPFYEGSTLDIVAIFQDTFHGTGIDDGTIMWEVVAQPFSGQLDFVFLGFYEGTLPLFELDPGNYTLRLTGEKTNYEDTSLDQPIEVLPKWNVSIAVIYPDHFMEGNSYQIPYNCTYTELGGPLVGESITFFINYTHADKQENFNVFTGDNGLVTITLAIPNGETEVNISVSYGGKTNVSTWINSTAFPVITRYSVSLDILPTDYAAELVGETNVEIQARLTYTNGTPVVNATLVFHVSTSEVSVLTDITGLAIAFVKLPTEGTYSILVEYAGTSTIQTASKPGAKLNIISPTAAFMNQVIQYAMYIGIVAAIVFGLYIGVSRGVVRPKQRARQAEYVGLMNRFEDARNIQLLMLINKESGTEIYSKALSGVPVDPTLVTGFLQAITTFGKELIAEDRAEMQGPKALLAMAKGKAETRILEFHHFKILLEETAHLRIALLLLKNPSQRLLNALHKFAERAETRFGAGVDQLRGRQLSDDDVWELIEDAFEPSLIYVHMTDLVNARSITPTKWEKVVLDEIKKAPFYGEAYLDTLQEQIAHQYIGKELEIVDAGISLRQKNVLLALSPRYMEVRLTIRKAIDALPGSAKLVILTIGDGEHNAAKIIQKVKIPQTELTNIVQQLQELGIVTEKLQLDMAGKLVYTTLKIGAEKLKK